MRKNIEFDQIMLLSVPDLTGLDLVFPHVPAVDVFRAMREKEVDVICGEEFPYFRSYWDVYLVELVFASW